MKKNNKIFLIIIFIIIIIVVIPITRNKFTQVVMYLGKPFASVASLWASDSRGFLTGLTEISSLRKENSDLVQKLKSINISSVELEELRHENEVLKQQLGFLEEHQESELIPARIIGREPFGALDRIIIDKGAKDSVRKGSAVVANGAIIGRVGEVFEDQSKIVLITSKDSIVQVMLQKSRTLGILKGSLNGVKMENIPQDTVIEDGEAIITSGLGGEIESGILVGWANGEVSYKSEIYKVVDVEIAEDLNKLEQVFVIK